MNTGIAHSMEIASDSSNTPREDYDKLETVVITLNEDGLQSENELIRTSVSCLTRKCRWNSGKRNLRKTATFR